jgi:hypothetical protein
VDRDEPVVVPVSADGEGDEELITTGPRLPRWALLAAISVVAAGALTALAIKTNRHPTAAPIPSATPTPIASSPAPQRLAGLSVQDFAMGAGGELYVLTSPPAQLVAVDRNGSIRSRALAPPDANLVVANPTSDLVWLIVPKGGGSAVFVYAGSTTAAIGQFDLPAKVVAADVLGNQLWMATDRGVYRGWPGQHATLLSGYTGPVQAITADPSRFRLLAVSTSYDLITVDERGARKVRRLTTVLPKSIAVTDDGIWVVGFGRPLGSRLGRVDPRTLHVTPVGGTDADAPRGASGWSGGSVLWIKYADSGSVVCLDGRTGEASAAYTETDTPVVSVPGVVYALRGTRVVKLPSTRACSG